MPLLLELFCGTKSVGKIAERRGYTVISLDNRPPTDPTICVDLLEWNYKDIATPDFIWASPPCTTFSIAAHGVHRNLAHMEGFTEASRVGLLILRKTLEIIRYFEGKNKNLQWCFENPRGFMRHTTEVMGIRRETCCYCKYGHPFKKPTDIFSNFPLDLVMCREKRGEHVCHHKRGKTGIATASMNDRFKIPAELLESIFDQSGSSIWTSY